MIDTLKIGFVGSSEGLSDYQVSEVYRLITSYKTRYEHIEFHHGDGKGDSQAALVARDLGCLVISHPTLTGKGRAYFPSNVIWKEKQYRERNKDLVLSTSILIAAPGEDTNHPTSHVWSTVRLAKHAARDYIILSRFPESELSQEPEMQSGSHQKGSAQCR